MTDTITFTTTPFVAAGARVFIAGESNRVRRRAKMISATRVELETFIRPSRGYAKHTRRVKARQRRQ